MIIQDDDGKSHINVYSKGRTELGRMLSNFHNVHQDLGEDGAFSSLEGYWYWLLTGDDRLRNLWGYKAKQLGQELTDKKEWLENQDDIERFKLAMKDKAKTPRIREMLKESELPFKHYYVFNEKVIEPRNGLWMLEEWERIRKEIKNENR